MAVAFDEPMRDISPVSERYQFHLSARKPGAPLGLSGLENAFTGLLTYQRFPLPDGPSPEEISTALTTTRDLLVRTYQVANIKSPADEVAELERKVGENLDRLRPARGQGME